MPMCTCLCVHAHGYMRACPFEQAHMPMHTCPHAYAHAHAYMPKVVLNRTREMYEMYEIHEVRMPPSTLQYSTLAEVSLARWNSLGIQVDFRHF